MSRKNALNLDNLFGYVFDNVVAEELTPRKIAIFYLIKEVFRSHFGYRAIPSTRPLKPREKTLFFTIVFGLIQHEEDISYEDFRRVVRLVDSEIRRGIYLAFVVSMEKLATGVENVDLRVEDSMYTGKREYHELAVYELPLTKPLIFMNIKSYVYMWVRKMVVQWKLKSQDVSHRMNVDMKNWLLPKNEEKNDFFELYPSIKYKMECSTKARLWVSGQIRSIEIAPSIAVQYDISLEWCNTIKTKHPDVFSVYLLESLIHIRKQNQAKAEECIKKFFDLSMFKLNDNSVNASQTHRFAIACQKPLRYAPLLQGRICRLFGDIRNAKSLLTESIQQSQISGDDPCNRLANVELTSIGVLRARPLLEKAYENDDPTDKDKRVVQQDLHRGAEMDEHTHLEAFPVYPEEGFELHEQLVSMAKVLCSLEEILSARYCIKTSENMETGLRVVACSDYYQKTRQMDDTAIAISTSNLIRNGMYKQAQHVCKELLNGNFSSHRTVSHETESQVVAGVNLAYSTAALGDYDQANAIVMRLEHLYPANLNWLCARHVKICRLLISFERSFLNGEYNYCEQLLEVLGTYSDIETVLRKGLLMATCGDISGSIELLSSFKCSDILGKTRIKMQLASIYMSCGRWEKAEESIEECSKYADGTTVRNIRAMIARRAANLLYLKKEVEQSMKMLMAVRIEMESFGSVTERILYYFLIAKLMGIQNENPSFYLAKARNLVTRCKWYSMEKLIVAETAKYYDYENNAYNLERVVQMFSVMDERVKTQLAWMLI